MTCYFTYWPFVSSRMWFSSVVDSVVGKLYLSVNKKFWEELIAYFPWYDTSHIENFASNSSIVAFVFVTSVTFLPSRCLATIRGFLLSWCLAMIRGLLPSCCLATIGGIYRHTHRQQRDLISLLYFLAYFPWCDMGHIENNVSNNSAIVSCVLILILPW
jgi:hypothetical protein